MIALLGCYENAKYNIPNPKLASCGVCCLARRRDLVLPHQIVHLIEQLVRAVGLLDEAAVVGNIGPSRFFASRRDDQKHVRPAGVDFARQAHAVQSTGHLDVGEKQPHLAMGFERLERAGGVAGLDDIKSMLFKEPGCIEPHKLLIIHHQGCRLRGGRLCRHEPDNAGSYVLLHRE